MAGYSSHSSTLFLLLLVVVSGWGGLSKCEAFGTFGFDVHHRFSDPVKGILAVDELPEKGSVNYYAVMAHRDRLIRGRRLASLEQQTPLTALTFLNGNDTYRIEVLGFLHYANVSVGTPALSFLVALDTGSDLFWLPCDCTSCVHGLKSSTGQIDFNIYSTNTSSTASKVPCNNTLCARQTQCPSPNSNCPYQVRYLSNGTSSTGILVEDLLHLTSEDKQSKAVNAPITFGCGQVQTGSFLDGAAPNGLFGLGMADISVPSMLSKAGLASNSFSMCFGHDGIGRISFGDKGSANQSETPFNLRQTHPAYNVSISQISVGGNVADLEFSAIFDSGTSFTYLNDPAYTLISESFNTLALEERHSSDSGLPFEYCYDLSPNNKSFKYPIVSLTMKGGEKFLVNDPVLVISMDSGDIYCLGVVKSEDVNIIGQNFMTGYRIVFDREKMVLGWKASDCFSRDEFNSLPVSPPKSKAFPPAISVNPEATAIPTPGNGSPQLNPLTLALVIFLFPVLIFS
ncbi:aspartyl protease family protein 1 [Carica papaya]|uniref:aspartyl protease family protein 1 n=1 Tax=Carica papaya TaxID=3649 RepID=UPI000B8C956C|nr:aspartyl protease family protein 1 [Carica papaya]